MKSLLPMACLLAAVAPLSHAATARAEKLPQPKNMTCLQVSQAISYPVTRGLLHLHFSEELGRGAYVSEREDARGVYYRAPEGAITERRTDTKDGSMAGRAMTFDGGIYVPNDATVAPTLYKYYATDSVLTQSAPGNTDCATLSYTVDPMTHKLSVVAIGAAAGMGAATGMLVGRSVHPHVHTSYGQAAGVGLVGGLIGGMIVAAIENSKVGEILPGPALDSQAAEKIRVLAANKSVVGEPSHAGGPNMAITTSANHELMTAATSPPPLASSATQNMAQTGANGVVQTLAATPQAAPIAATAMASEAAASLAQSVASQMGCGDVKASGEGYAAPCGSYGVYIGCDAGKCRPLHTVKLENEQ